MMFKTMMTAVILVAGLASAAASATTVLATDPNVTDLGTFAAGKYRITGTGLVDLVGPVGSGFTIRPDGMPDTSVTYPGYSYFNPSGSTTADGSPGSAPGFKIGALVGSFLAAPAQVNSDWFLIGYGTVITLAAPGHIYAAVNDTFRANNGGAFEANVVAVPEPASWALLIAGFGLTGAALRRRRIAATA